MADPNRLIEKFGPNFGYIEEVYNLYLQDPSFVGKTWQKFFESYESDSINSNNNIARATTRPEVRVVETNSSTGSEQLPQRLQESVYRLVYSYRNYGHLKAQTNPLQTAVSMSPEVYRLDPEFYRFTAEQLKTQVHCYRFMNREDLELGTLIRFLEEVYCGPIGFEYQHILAEDERYWLREKIENRFETGFAHTPAQKIRRLQKVIDAEIFEEQLHKRYIGQKRFSLEGGETIIPIISDIIEHACELNQSEVVLGMAHRGRLNVLRNILGKPLREIFYEFEDKKIYADIGSGDVKYHMGFDSYFNSPDGHQLRLSLLPNPSHLEFVYPVIQGVARAKQDMHYKKDRNSVVPVVLHGDASFIGQGVVAEALNLAYVDGFQTGGTIHIIINNQIGFTTSPVEARSSIYCTDFAKAIQAPILHVNGEDVLSCCWAAHLALEYRNKFNKDIVIDVYCYRKHGHNEGDDPSITHPLLYKEIKKKKNISEIYSKMLIENNVVHEEQVLQYRQGVKDEFDREHSSIRESEAMGEACPMHGRLKIEHRETGVESEKLNEIVNAFTSLPVGIAPYPKLKSILEKRAASFNEDQLIDWGLAETLAYGSLLQGGVDIRLTGQDSGRGTFSHRLILNNDYETAEHYNTLQSIIDNYGSQFEIYNSTLSEAGVLGFEFGYSTVARNSLVLWEAQFGDFANGAQVIIDQFLSSSEQKWNQLSSLVLLLPHGYEGQGPEHSSARLERFLQLSADGNMHVCYPSSSAQFFHLLRQHALSKIKRPLIIMTPKSLLRAKEAVCSLQEFTGGHFYPVLAKDYSLKGKSHKLVFTSGKVFYDIDKALSEQKNANTKVIRLEQLYPFPQFEIKKIIKNCNADSCIWVQEEPLNMGSWLYIEPFLRTKLGFETSYVGRDLSASPATGSPTRHATEQEEIMEDLIDSLGI